jgi:TPR repeat protein
VRDRVLQPALLLGLLALLGARLPAHAGVCRSQLRPLLLQAQPEPAAIAAVRNSCAAEAEAGDADATYQLALFHLGLGGEWNPGEAIPLIRSAAERDVSEAQYWLAWQSEGGPELPHDQAIALGWYQRAAAGRHRLALERLATARERGELGLKPDATEALKLRAQIRKCDEENAR